MSAEYEFRIQGRVSCELLGTFAPLVAVPSGTETVLVGPIVDRAQLHGALARFEMLGLELVEMRRLPERPALPAPGVETSANPDTP